MPKLKETKPSIIKLLYQLLYDFHQIMTNNGIKYWIDGGTLLGAVRHKGIIPWDDDADVGLLSKDIKRFLALEKDFKKCGYSITKTWFGYKVFYSNRKILEDFSYSFPFLDVLPYRKFSDGKYRLSLKEAREEWFKEVWAEDELFPLVEYEFGEFNVLGPNKSENYFNQYYGKDWNDIAYREYDHQKEEEVEMVKVKLTARMRKAAKPTDEIKERKCVKACLKKSKKRSPTTDYWMKKESKKCSHSGGCYKNFNTKMGVYVISCAMHKSRYNKFLEYADKAGVKACRIPCVLGKKFTQQLICDLIKEKKLVKNADMTTIEISINMSHYNAWQKLLNSCNDYALILEDDVELSIDFAEKINKLMEALQKKDIDFSIFQLWDGIWDEGDRKQLMKVENMTIMKQIDEYNSGAAAYIISRKYAEFLMKKFFPIKMPQDMLMGTYYKTGNHLALKMKYRAKDECYLSPILNMSCGGAGGTGEQTTQEHTAPTVGKRWSCEKCCINC